MRQPVNNLVIKRWDTKLVAQTPKVLVVRVPLTIHLEQILSLH